LITNCPNESGAPWRSKAWSGTKTAKSIKPSKVSNAATANNTRRNQTPDAAETAVLAAVGVKPEEFSDTLTSCDFRRDIVTGQTGRLEGQTHLQILREHFLLPALPP
jgi:hypothetical protein